MYFLSVKFAAETGELTKVREENGYLSALATFRLVRSRLRPRARQGSAALAAEFGSRRIGEAAAGTGDGQRCAASAAELMTRRIGRSATRAIHLDPPSGRSGVSHRRIILPNGLGWQPLNNKSGRSPCSQTRIRA